MGSGKDFNIPYYYQIVIKGRLDPNDCEKLDGFLFFPQWEDVTLMSGVVSDQAALHGMFSIIRDLGLSILFVKREDSDAESVYSPGNWAKELLFDASLRLSD
ncbi:MAG: hypothetical protein U9R58_01215 [Chloroflexota bacterium]|nr:hypothetical protein [Chloroflexota bacterium]